MPLHRVLDPTLMGWILLGLQLIQGGMDIKLAPNPTWIYINLHKSLPQGRQIDLYTKNLIFVALPNLNCPISLVSLYRPRGKYRAEWIMAYPTHTRPVAIHIIYVFFSCLPSSNQLSFG